MTIRNPILATDSYKFSHFMQYPADTTNVSSYIEARGTQIPGVTEVVFAGLQVYINCKYQVQLKDDGAYPKALKRMLKEGLLKRERTNHGGRKQQSKIVLA